MYDVKQADRAEWSSPPWDAALVDLPDLGKVVMGRGAENQKGPQAAFLAALHAIRGAGRKLPVNLVLVAEGEEEVGSTNLAQVVHHPHVQALATLITPERDPAVDGFMDEVRPLTAAELAMIDAVARTSDEATDKRTLGVARWTLDADYRQSLVDLCQKPTLSIEGLVGGYTGPGGKTILPHRAVAKIDIRLVPDMTADATIDKLKAHLAKRGFGDIEVNILGGIDETTTTPAESAMIRAEVAAYRKSGVAPLLWPRMGGSWPGHLFTGKPLSLAAGHFGMGHGAREHGSRSRGVHQYT